MNKNLFVVRSLTVGLLVGMIALLVVGLATTADASGFFRGHVLNGALAQATVSFGQWKTSPPLDRFPNLSPRDANNHELLPNEVRIEQGGAVNFVISGFHEVLIYGPGTRPESINASLTVPSTGTPPGVPLINDPRNRIFRGVDPSTQPTQDRVESVTFANTGRYLVICAVQPHFVQDGMYGFVRVVGDRDRDD